MATDISELETITIEVPEYGTSVQFPRNMAMEDINEIMGANFPSVQEISNPDGSFRINMGDLPIQPVAKAEFSVGEKSAFTLRQIRSNYGDLGQAPPEEVLKGAFGDPADISDPGALPQIIGGLPAFVAGTGRKMFDTFLKGTANTVLKLAEVLGSKSSDRITERMARMSFEEIDASGDRTAKIISDIFPQTKTEISEIQVENVSKFFEKAEDITVENIAEGYAKLLGGTEAEKANIKAFVRITGDIGLLGFGEIVKVIKSSKASRNAKRMEKEAGQARKQADAAAENLHRETGMTKEQFDNTILKESRDLAEARLSEKVTEEMKGAEPTPESLKEARGRAEADLTAEVVQEKVKTTRKLAEESKESRDKAEASLLKKLMDQEGSIRLPDKPSTQDILGKFYNAAIPVRREQLVRRTLPEVERVFLEAEFETFREMPLRQAAVEVAGELRTAKAKHRGDATRSLVELVKNAAIETEQIRKSTGLELDPMDVVAAKLKAHEANNLPQFMRDLEGFDQPGVITSFMKERIPDRPVKPLPKRPIKDIELKPVPKKPIKELVDFSESLLRGEAGAIRLPDKLPERIKERIKPFLLTPEEPSILRPTKKGVDVMELNRQRSVGINSALLSSEKFVRDVTAGLSKTELEAIPFIRQGIKDPTLLKDSVREVVENPSPAVKKATAEIGKYMDESFEFLKEHGVDISYVDNYVTQIWDIPKNRRPEAVRFFTTHNPFTKKRKIPSLEEGIKLGLTPKTTNIADILRIYDQFKIKTVFNKKYAEALVKMKDAQGQFLIQPATGKKAGPVDWPTIDAPALNRAVFVGKTKKGVPIIANRPVKVNPEIAIELNAVFGTGLPRKYEVIPAIQVINAYVKKTTLSLSGFHAGALTEAAIAARIGKKALKLWNPIEAYKAIKNKDYEIFKRMDIAKDAIEHNVEFGAVADVHRSRIQQDLLALERKTQNTPGLKHITKGVRKFNDMWDEGLWNYYHNTLKLEAYEVNVKDAIRAAELNKQKTSSKSLTLKETEAIKNTVGSLVNDLFGGQNWETKRVLGDPAVREAMQILLLSPDWQVSTLKQAAAPIRGPLQKAKLKKQLNRGEISQGEFDYMVKGPEALGRQGQLFWLRTAIYFNVIGNILNYTNTKRETGQGRMMWDNPTGRKLDIFYRKNKNAQGEVIGPDIYVGIGKQFKEPLRWFSAPIETFGGKLGPVTREALRQVTQVDPGTSFPTEFRDKEGLEKIIERGKSLIGAPIPFSLRPFVNDRPAMFMFAFPTKTGMTNFRARNLFKDELKKEKIDMQQIRKIAKWSLENNLNATRLFEEANANLKRDLTLEAKDIARPIFDELMQVPLEQRSLIIEEYSKIGMMTDKIAIELLKLMQEHEEIRQQRKALKGK